MKLVTTTGFIGRRLGVKKVLEMIAKSGFDGYDCTMFGVDDEFCPEYVGENGLKNIKELKRFADTLGLPCLQAHAPCPSVPKFSTVERYVETSLQAIRYAHELECPILVVHPATEFNEKENYERIYAPLMESAKSYGVRVATENMYKWKDEKEIETVPAACGTAEDFVNHIDYAKNSYLTACLDIGHAQMQNCEGAVKLIKALGKERLSALHVHDNDLCNDYHTFPFVGKSDWDEITTALAGIGYDGCFTFEADAFMRTYPDELLSACLSLLEKTGRYLIKEIERKKARNE